MIIITIEQIQYFLAVKQFNNFSNAANELCISQSSLSKQIKSLENELDILLDVNFPHTASAKKLATKNPTITGTLSPIANTTGINGVSKAITGAALTSSV